MTELNVIRCLLCKQSFDRTEHGTDSYLEHRKTCHRITNHSTTHTPKRSA
jgi:hypothetical protein